MGPKAGLFRSIKCIVYLLFQLVFLSVNNFYRINGISSVVAHVAKTLAILELGPLAFLASHVKNPPWYLGLCSNGSAKVVKLMYTKITSKKLSTHARKNGKTLWPEGKYHASFVFGQLLMQD